MPNQQNHPHPGEDQLLDVAGAADVAGCPPRWIRRAVYDGEIKILTGSRRLLIPLSEYFNRKTRLGEFSLLNLFIKRRIV
jgi:hypothetical protein